MRTAAKAAFGLVAFLTLGASAPAFAQYASPGYSPPGYGPPGSYGGYQGPQDNGGQYPDTYSGQYSSPYPNQSSGQYYGDPNAPDNASDNASDSGAYGDPGYGDQYGNPSADNAYGACDYYTPPWGYPPDYCNYQIWSQPVFVGGDWYEGPIYYRYSSGAPYFWIHGGWHRDEWRGARPRVIDWGHGRNIRWNGDVHHRDARGFQSRTQSGRGGFQGAPQRFNRPGFDQQGFNRQGFNRQGFNGQNANAQNSNRPGFGGQVQGNVQPNTNGGGRHRGGFGAQNQAVQNTAGQHAQNNGGANSGNGFLHPRGEHRHDRNAQTQAGQNNANANANANNANANNGDHHHHHHD